MKHGPGVTSAVDIIAPKPAARPEPSTKASSRDEDRTSFANALDAETAEPEAAPTKEATKETVTKETTAKDEPTTPDTNAAAQPVQPQQPQPTPAVNSPEAILAGLTQAVPTDAPTAEAGAATPAIDAAAAAGAAQSAGKAATPQPAAPQADAAPAATPEQTAEAVATNAAAKPAAPAQQTAPTATAPTAAPATDEAAPLSAPGEERTSATIETAGTNNKTTATTTSNAVDPAANKAQGTQNKPAQAAAAAATDIKVDVKADTQAPTTTATPIDTLAGRTSNPDIARVAPAHTAMQNAPATTVQVYQRMVERFDGRAQRYEIRLDPAELGRVDVRIEVGADKKVHAVLAAHDSAALTDLMRGQRQLERALNDAGIDLGKDGIRFELSSEQNRNSANNFNGNDGNGRSNVWRGFNTVDVAVDAQTAAAARPWRSSSRLDVVA